MNQPRWIRRMREAGAASSAAMLERPGASGDGDGDDKPCPDCNGTGIDDGGVCDTCNGSGSVMREATAPQVNCPTCEGSGKIRGGGVDCPDCDGSGKVAASSVRESEVAQDFAALHEAAPLDYFGDGSLRESAVKRLSEKDYSTDTRTQMAKDGNAIPIRNDKGDVTGGAYPIANGGDVDNAIAAYGRNPTPETKSHIVKRAKAVGTADQVKRAQALGQTKESTSLLERLDRLEREGASAARLREAHPGVLTNQVSPMTRVRTSSGQEGYAVVLIREGKGNADDDAWYTGAAIRELCESGVAEGMQAYGNHPSMTEEEDRPERDVKQLVGCYQDVKFAEAGGKARADAVFVPLTTDENHPHYGWVVTLAEAAVKNSGPQPLAGISLYGLSSGIDGDRPDGSFGRLVECIRPTSGDIVTNAGAGGEFVRKLMRESARLRAHNTQPKEQPMQAAEYKTKLTEATKRLREADSDESRAAAITDLEALQAIEIDAPPKAPESIEALTESAPKLVEQLREAAKAEVGADKEAVEKQLREAQERLTEADKFISGITDVQGIVKVLREDAKLEDDVDIRYFTDQARARRLKESADIVSMVETERAYRKRQDEEATKRLRESLGLGEGDEIEGVPGRLPEPPADAGLALLRENGIPTKDPAAAAAA